MGTEAASALAPGAPSTAFRRFIRSSSALSPWLPRFHVGVHVVAEVGDLLVSCSVFDQIGYVFHRFFSGTLFATQLRQHASGTATGLFGLTFRIS